MNGFPRIGHLAIATEEQFKALYQQKYRDVCTEWQFLQEYNGKKQIAINDLRTLEDLGVSVQDIGDQFFNIVSEVKKADQTTRQAVVGSLKAERDGLCMQGYDHCLLCEERIAGPGYYKIKNTLNDEELIIRDLSLHLIKDHGYFSKEAYRLDPTKACKVLGFPK